MVRVSCCRAWCGIVTVKCSQVVFRCSAVRSGTVTSRSVKVMPCSVT